MQLILVKEREHQLHASEYILQHTIHPEMYGGTMSLLVWQKPQLSLSYSKKYQKSPRDIFKTIMRKKNGAGLMVKDGAGRVSAQQLGDNPSETLCGSPGRAGATPHTSICWSKLPGELRGHCSLQQTDSHSQLCFTSETSFKCSALGSSPMGDWKTLGSWGCLSSVHCQDNISRENIWKETCVTGTPAAILCIYPKKEYG